MASPTGFSQAPPMGFFTLEPLSSAVYFFFSIKLLEKITIKFTFSPPNKRSQIAGFEL